MAAGATAARWAPPPLTALQRLHSLELGRNRLTDAALVAARLVLVGGAPLGHRHMEWNFVSSRRERIVQAQADWSAQRHAQIDRGLLTLGVGHLDLLALPGAR